LAALQLPKKPILKPRSAQSDFVSVGFGQAPPEVSHVAVPPLALGALLLELEHID